MASDVLQMLNPGIDEETTLESLFHEASEQPIKKLSLALDGYGNFPIPNVSQDHSVLEHSIATMENSKPIIDLSSPLDSCEDVVPSLSPFSSSLVSDGNMENDIDGLMFRVRNESLAFKEEDDDEDNASCSSPPSSPTALLSDNIYHETSTTLSLIDRSGNLRLDDRTLEQMPDNGSLFGGLSSAFTHKDNCDTVSAPRLRKPDSSSSITLLDQENETCSPTMLDGRTSGFVFTKFGIKGKCDGSSPVSESGLTSATVFNTESPTLNLLSKKSVMSTRSPKGGAYRSMKKLKEPALNLNFPPRVGNMELKVIEQPEEQHRARYLTEGSRGAIKDRSQNGFPIVQLLGCDKPAKLQVFIGSDQGRIKPHGFYQSCQVCGKNSSQSMQKDIEGTTVIEIPMDPSNNMVANIDCVGILKLRNADVEQRIGLTRSKKRSTKARLVFRTNLPNPDGTYTTLQVHSSPILCTQPAGAPEICKKSLEVADVCGGQELFVIGKNFSKGTRVFFSQYEKEKEVWTTEAEIDQDYFHQTHMIVIIPPYKTPDIKESVEVQIVVHSSTRVSEPCPLVYKSALVQVKLEETAAPVMHIPMEIEATNIAKAVSREALGLNEIYQQALSQGEKLTSQLVLNPTLPQRESSNAGMSSHQLSERTDIMPTLSSLLKQEDPIPPAWSKQSSQNTSTKRTIDHLLSEDPPQPQKQQLTSPAAGVSDNDKDVMHHFVQFLKPEIAQEVMGISGKMPVENENLVQLLMRIKQQQQQEQLRQKAEQQQQQEQLRQKLEQQQQQEQIRQKLEQQHQQEQEQFRQQQELLKKLQAQGQLKLKQQQDREKLKQYQLEQEMHFKLQQEQEQIQLEQERLKHIQQHQEQLNLLKQEQDNLQLEQQQQQTEATQEQQQQEMAKPPESLDVFQSHSQQSQHGITSPVDNFGLGAHENFILSPPPEPVLTPKSRQDSTGPTDLYLEDIVKELRVLQRESKKSEDTAFCSEDPLHTQCQDSDQALQQEFSPGQQLTSPPAESNESPIQAFSSTAQQQQQPQEGFSQQQQGFVSPIQTYQQSPVQLLASPVEQTSSDTLYNQMDTETPITIKHEDTPTGSPSEFSQQQEIKSMSTSVPNSDSSAPQMQNKAPESDSVLRTLLLGEQLSMNNQPAAAMSLQQDGIPDSDQNNSSVPFNQQDLEDSCDLISNPMVLEDLMSYIQEQNIGGGHKVDSFLRAEYQDIVPRDTLFAQQQHTTAQQDSESNTNTNLSQANMDTSYSTTSFSSSSVSCSQPMDSTSFSSSLVSCSQPMDVDVEKPLQHQQQDVSTSHSFQPELFNMLSYSSAVSRPQPVIMMSQSQSTIPNQLSGNGLVSTLLGLQPQISSVSTRQEPGNNSSVQTATQQQAAGVSTSSGNPLSGKFQWVATTNSRGQPVLQLIPATQIAGATPSLKHTTQPIQPKTIPLTNDMLAMLAQKRQLARSKQALQQRQQQQQAINVCSNIPQPLILKTSSDQRVLLSTDHSKDQSQPHASQPPSSQPQAALLVSLPPGLAFNSQPSTSVTATIAAGNQQQSLGGGLVSSGTTMTCMTTSQASSFLSLAPQHNLQPVIKVVNPPNNSNAGPAPTGNFYIQQPITIITVDGILNQPTSR